MLVLTSACGAAPRARRPGTLSARARTAQTVRGPCETADSVANPRVCAIARLDGDAVEVTLRIDPEALPEDHREVRLAFREDTFGDRYVEDFVEVANGAWPDSLGRVDAPVELTYRVALDFYERGQPRHGRERISWRRPNGWHLTGRTFLPDVWIDGERVVVPATLAFELDGPLWTSAGGEQRVFDAGDLARLADEAYEVGPLFVERHEVGSTVLIVASSEHDETLERTSELLAHAMEALTARLGPPPTDSVLFAFHAIDEPVWAERLGSSIVQIGRDGLPNDPILGRTALAIRELAHVWSPGTHTIAEDWLEEGVTDYFVVRVLSELLEAPSASTVRVVMRAHRRYVQGAERRTLREETNGGRWAYDAGLALGFCLDGHLRESGSSLGALLRTTLTREETVIGAESLLEDLAAVSPSSASYLDALLATEGAFAIDDCLERAGFTAREVSYDGWSDRVLAHEVLGIVAMTELTHAQGFEVDEVSAGSPFAVDDVVLEIEGVRVATLDDVAWALRDVRASQPFRAVVRRSGDAHALSIDLPAIDADQREERAYVELQAIDRTVATR